MMVSSGEKSNDYSGSHLDLFDAIEKKDLKLLKKLLKRNNLELTGFQNLTVLHLAARWGDADTLRVLLENKKVAQLLECKMYNGDTPLLTAVRHNNVEAARVLIDNGADMEMRKVDTGNTVIHFAARIADSELMNMLLSRNLSANLLNSTNFSGESALEVAVKEHSPTVQVLLQAGADYSKPNVYTGMNILHACVAYNQCGLVQELLTSGSSRKLVDLVDLRGDIPLMLAIRIACFSCIKNLIRIMKAGQEFNKLTGENIVHMAVETDDDQILRHVLLFCNENVANQRNAKGMTPLLVAIEDHKDNCLETLIESTNIMLKSSKTQETALHVAVRVDNRSALSNLLRSSQPNICWFFSQKDYKGNTPFWVAIELGHAVFVIESRKGGWASVDEFNKFGDSTVYVAAAQGHLKVLKALLLSERYYEFCRDHEKDTDLKEEKLIRNAEICCDIHNTDIFILTGKTKKNNTNSWYPKHFLKANLHNGRNIFHACALGGNILCLDFVYTFCKSFNLSLPLFDAPDKNGNTPLLLATTNDFGGPQCVYFFLSKGASISSCNNSGNSVLNSLLVYTESSLSLLGSVLNEGIIYDMTIRGLQEESECLQVNFSLFRPPNEAASLTKVVKLFYESVKGPKSTKVLQHTLIKIYVHLILVSLSYFFIFRFVISCSSTVLLTIYLIFYSEEQRDYAEKSIVIQGIRYTLCTLSVLGILFSVPLLYHHKTLCLIALVTDALMLLPCLMILLLIVIPYGSELVFDIAALTVLVSWLSLMMYSTALFKEISHQIAMLSHVIHGLTIYFRIVFLILLPFSIAFYCIFNDHFYLVNPVKSFIYTGFILLQGDTIASFEYFESKHSFLNSSNGKHLTTNEEFVNTISLLDFCFEGMFLVVFTITCILGLLNMLVGLAVRDGKTLAADGEIFRRHLQIYWLNSLENFLESFLYKILRRTPLIYLFGIIPSRTLIDLKTKYSPMMDRNRYVFPSKTVIDMKKSFRTSTKQEILEENTEDDFAYKI